MAEAAFKTPTQEQINTAAAFMYDVFAATGNYSGVPKRSTDYAPIEDDKKKFLSLFRKIFLTVKCRSLVTDSTKDAFNSTIDRCYMASRAAEDLEKGEVKFCTKLPSSGVNPEPMYKPNKMDIINYIVWFCVAAHLYWDDTLLTDAEMDEVYDSVLGGVLKEYGCFISQVNPAEKKEDSEKAPEEAEEVTVQEVPAERSTEDQPTEEAPEKTEETPAEASAEAPAASGTAVKYSQSGSHLNDIPNIRNKSKVQLDPVFSITADQIGSNMPAAFITPILWDPTKKTIMRQVPDRAKIVKFASGNGYTDCELFFKTAEDAEKFRDEIMNNGLTNRYQNVRVVRPKTDKGSYFEVDTFFGPAYIRAKKLNEDLIEAMEAEQPEKRSSASYEINDIQSFSEMLLNCN